MTEEKKVMSQEEKQARKRSDALIDEMLAEHGISPEAILGRHGLVAQLTKRVVEKALAGELTHHLGYEKEANRPRKTVATGAVPRR